MIHSVDFKQVSKSGECEVTLFLVFGTCVVGFYEAQKFQN